jgi:flagellar motor protein MotB
MPPRQGLPAVSHLLYCRTLTAVVIAGSLMSMSGCSGRYAYAPPGQPAPITLTPEQQTALAQQTQQYQQRANTLDRDNQELETLLAQSRQQVQLLEEQIRATQGQLRDTTDRLATTQAENDQLRGRTTALAASMQTRSQAEIRANNSLLRSLSIANLPGINVRQDGDVIRIELPGDQLFNPGTVQLKAGADGLLRSVAADLVQNYPQQLIGIEGHGDGSAMSSPQFPTDQHLTVAQAMAVYDVLTRAGGMPPKQLFVVGHGSAHPVVSNATDAGRARNRRIDVVVYPETMNR